MHDLLGGELLGADVYLDGARIEAHMWNRLIGEPTGIQRTPAIADPAHPRYHRYEAYLVVSDRVEACLGLVGCMRPGS